MSIQARKMTDRDLSEAIARCLGVLVFYHNDRGSKEAQVQVEAESHRLVTWATKFGMDRPHLTDSVLVPLESELLARYGPVEGPRLLGRFLKPSGVARVHQASASPAP